ncbi:MAG: hypothetical protein R6V04_03615 [bacterium]
MWEDQIAELVASLKKKLINNQEQIKYRKIVEDNTLPKYIKNLFKIKVKSFYQQESPLEFKSTTHFKLNSDDIKEYRDKLVNVFWEGAIFTREDIEEILKEALVLRLNYLVKPIDTIRRLLFEDKDNISLENMDQILTSFKTILPYAEIIIKECSSQGKSLIDKNIFSNIATEQLQNIFQEDVVTKVLKDFSKLADFLSEVKGTEIKAIEGKTLQKFFADRNLWGFRRALEIEMKINGEVFTAQNLEVIMKRYMELKSDFEGTGELENLDKGQELKDTENIEEKVIEKQEEQNLTAEQQTLEEVIEEERTSESLDWELEESADEDEEQEEEKIEPEKKSKKEKKKNKHMRIIRRDEDSERKEIQEQEQEEMEENTYLDLGLKDLIDSKMEKGFIKKLFDNNAKAYENVINKLNKTDSWREAKVLIDNELFKRDVDPFSREAIKLVDMVYGIFYPEEGVGGK